MVAVILKSSQLIHGYLVDKGSVLQICFAAVYGLHIVETRKIIWQDLLAIDGVEDRFNGVVVTTAETQDFAHLLSSSDLGECKFMGHFYCWSNKSIGEARTCSRIDRCVVNSPRLVQYYNVVVEYMNPGISNHSPLVLQCVAPGQSKGRPFKFFNYMVEHEYFLHIIEIPGVITGVRI